MMFQQALQDAEAIIKKSKDRFKADLIQSAEEYKRRVTQFVNDFNTNGPFGDDWTSQKALEKINQYRLTINNLKVDEERIRNGLQIFKIEQPPSKEIHSMLTVSIQAVPELMKFCLHQ